MDATAGAPPDVFSLEVFSPEGDASALVVLARLPRLGAALASASADLELAAFGERALAEAKAGAGSLVGSLRRGADSLGAGSLGADSLEATALGASAPSTAAVGNPTCSDIAGVAGIAGAAGIADGAEVAVGWRIDTK
jgi:hypothetical protein